MKRIYKEYIDNVEAVYPLASAFGDYTIVFYRVKYITNQKPFVPRMQNGVYPPLSDVLARETGKTGKFSVFRNLKIDKSKYRLLLEEPEENSEGKDWYEVAETYGYTPEITIETPILSAWTRPAFSFGIPPQAYSLTNATRAISGDDCKHAFYFGNSDGKIAAGDIITIKAVKITNLQTGENETTIFKSKEIPVVSAYANRVVTNEFDFISNGSKYSSRTCNLFDIPSDANYTVVWQEIKKNCSSEDVFETLHGEEDEASGNYVIYVDNSDGRIKEGDMVRLYRPYYRPSVGVWWYELYGDITPVLRAYSDRVITGKFGFGDGSSVSLGGFYVNPTKKILMKLAPSREAYSADFPAIQTTSFFTNSVDALSELKEAFTITSGGQVVNYVSEATTPSFEEYKTKIANGEELLTQPETAVQIMGDVWAKISITVPFQ